MWQEVKLLVVLALVLFVSGLGDVMLPEAQWEENTAAVFPLERMNADEQIPTLDETGAGQTEDTTGERTGAEAAKSAEKAEADQSQKEAEKPYTQEDAELLARLIACEMGCSWIADEQQLYVGSVVLNRVASDLFPGTLREVIYQPGQYAPAISGWLETVVPDERTRENARWLLENGSVLPEGVLYQSTVSQGPIYATYYDATLGTTTYYCYGG